MKLKYGIAPLAMAALLATGCQTTGVDGGTTSSTTQTSTSSASSSREMRKLAELERQNAQLRSANAGLKSDLSSVRSSAGSRRMASGGNGSSADLPPAKPGECYARILIPAKYQTSTEKMVDVEASERIEVIPATYEAVTERVLVREASERLEVVPATYRNVTETIVVEPARTELRTIPAKYETRTERVLVREGYTTWKKGSGPIGGALGGGTITDTRGTSTGEIMCLVEVPPEYRTVTKKVLVRPASTTPINTAAKTRSVTRRVVATPATTRAVPIPAKYDTVSVRKQVRPAAERRIPIPATFRTVTKQRKVGDESLVWREILCETNTTPDVIRRVQTALKAKGFSVQSDGVLGPSTMRALDAYQRRENLGTGGLTMATVKKLGVM